MTFKDKVVLVTGGSSGIGKAISIHFSKEKAKLVIVGRTKATVDEVKDVCTKFSGNEAMGIVADVSKEGDVESIVEKVTRAHDRLDVLVNNAGVFISDDIFTATTASFDAHINVNLRGTFNLTRLFVPLLIKSQGNIVNISGVEAVKYWEGLLTDSLSKVAIQHLTKYVAYELGSKKVRSNSVALGYVTGTKIIERANIDPEEFGRGFLPSVPLGEFIKPEDVAKTVAFVASDAARHITGQNIVMDDRRRVFKAAFKEVFKARWRGEWKANPPRADVENYDPTQKPFGFSAPRRDWRQMNRLRTEHGLCGDYMFKCGWRSSPECDCGAPVQSIRHIIYDCPKRKYTGNSLNPDVDAARWVKKLDIIL